MLFNIQIEAPTLQDALNQLNLAKPETVTPTPSTSPSKAPVASVPDAPAAIPDTPASSPDIPDDAPALTDVRAALAELRKAKGAAAAKAILLKHGVSSLTDLAEEAYSAVVQEAREAVR